MTERGIIPPEAIIADGQLHRCGTEGKPHGEDGAYLLHLDGLPAGGFENHRDGLGWQNWKADTAQTLTPEEKAAYRKKMEADRRAREARDEAKHEAAAKVARRAWDAARGILAHPYLTAKGVKPYGVRSDAGGNLVIPLYDAKGAIQSIQTIQNNGQKRFLTDGRKRGCYFPIGGKPDGVLCVCEGYATGASIHEAMGYPVAIAFDAGNLLPVAEALRGKYPGVTLILCADDDHNTEGNPGMTKARAAAQAVSGKLAIPVFGDNRPDGATDFNDLHKAQGTEAVKRCIEAAVKPESEKPAEKTPASGSASPTVKECPYTEVVTQRGDSVKPRPVNWLWRGWLASGKLHILAGAPGTGKTTIALALAAAITSGGRFPDGTPAPKGKMFIWSGEDNIEDTLAPRLIASGADMSMVRFVTGARDGEGSRAFDPARDIPALRDIILQEGGVSLLVIDPISVAIAGDSHKNTEVRRGLQPLADLADTTGVALLGITHLGKGTQGREPTERVLGSVAFGAAARLVMMAAKCQDGEGSECDRVFARCKSNNEKDSGGFAYGLRQSELDRFPGVFASSVNWGEAIEGTAREILADAEAAPEREGGALTEACLFLKDTLAYGSKPVHEVIEAARQEGLAERTIRRAVKTLGIRSESSGFGKGRIWMLPAQNEAENTEEESPMFAKKTHVCQQKKMANMEEFGKHGEDEWENVYTENPSNGHACDITERV
jgi:putative DNA primase/helicase